MKRDLPFLQQQYDAIDEFAKENGLEFDDFDKVRVYSGKGDAVMFEYQDHVIKALRNQNAQPRQTPPQIAPIPEPTNIQTPGDNDGEGTSLLIPGLILIGGVIGAILLSKKSSKRR